MIGVQMETRPFEKKTSCSKNLAEGIKTRPKSQIVLLRALRADQKVKKSRWVSYSLVKSYSLDSDPFWFK